MKIDYINGEACVSTGVLCEWLGLGMSVEALVAMVSRAYPFDGKYPRQVPFARTKIGVYWRYDDLPLIARSIAFILLHEAAAFDCIKRAAGMDDT